MRDHDRIPAAQDDEDGGGTELLCGREYQKSKAYGQSQSRDLGTVCDKAVLPCNSGYFCNYPDLLYCRDLQPRAVLCFSGGCTLQDGK